MNSPIEVSLTEFSNIIRPEKNKEMDKVTDQKIMNMLIDSLESKSSTSQLPRVVVEPKVSIKTKKTISKGSSKLTVDSDVRYIMFSQAQTRVVQTVQILRNQLDTTELTEEHVTIICADFDALEVYRVLFPKATIRIHSNTQGSIDKAAKYIENMMDNVKERYREMHDSNYQFMILDFIENDSPQSSMGYERLRTDPAAQILFNYAELCNMGFVINALLPESRYLKKALRLEHIKLSGVNGVVFNPAYSAYASLNNALNTNSMQDAKALQYRIATITQNMHTIYLNYTNGQLKKYEDFENMLCGLDNTDSILFVLPYGQIYNIGVTDEVVRIVDSAIDDVERKNMVLDSSEDSNDDDNNNNDNNDNDDSSSDSFVRIELSESKNDNENIENLVMVDNNDPVARIPTHPYNLRSRQQLPGHPVRYSSGLRRRRNIRK
jgi:hypothetical protein